ncbi:ABC transporter substrate-binding protein [Alkalimonas sp. MEB108]|uniref:ABC transporter substrate-binding protein n=1 Tax=Alkalimonas cellulosilytica TaxID=3058395 RepID=A0ABU7J0W7_9GAMM|nr:ABC transporter substrate-binding protein [Alkalimonas sp. MEB108]MEE1999972.1 ABC transporter substrate-binding protein [Alkalimonas sp. MEB108]
MQYFLISVCVLLSLVLPGKAAERAPEHVSSLHWVINTAPPFHILDGPFAGQGICDVLINVIDAHLAELDSERLVLPQSRIRQQFQRKENQCFPCMIFRPLPGETIQSEPTHFYYPHGIITTSAKAEMIKERHGNPVRLASLINDRSFRLGYPDGRHYPAVQHILDRAEQGGITLLAHTGENAPLAILSMIKMGRIDYTLEYQILHNFELAQQGTTDLVFLPVAETQGQHVLGAVGCTNTEWGQAAIQQINRVLPQVRQHPDFLQVLEVWFNDEPESAPYFELLRSRVWQTTD